MWLTASQALARLGSKQQSLYANVSRGRIRAKPDPADSRRSLYREEDIDRLAARARGRRSTATVASEAISWGDPVLSSGVSTVSDGRLYYRGRYAARLSDHATLEDIAQLLWDSPVSLPVVAEATAEPSIAATFQALAVHAASDHSSYRRGRSELQADAAKVLAIVANALLGPGDAPLHERLAARLGRPDAADVLRRALVLLADHELNSSTFAARVTVSTGSSLAAGALAGLAALSGPRHGSASTEVLALADDIDPDPARAAAELGEWLGEGRALPGFGHQLYPRGDIRARTLLAAFEIPPALASLAAAGEQVSGDAPNVDFALAALTAAHGLPREAPAIIFALARTVGWLAHMLEQASDASLIRPRARYVGLPLQVAT